MEQAYSGLEYLKAVIGQSTEKDEIHSHFANCPTFFSAWATLPHARWYFYLLSRLAFGSGQRSEQHRVFLRAACRSLYYLADMALSKDSACYILLQDHLDKIFQWASVATSPFRYKADYGLNLAQSRNLLLPEDADQLTPDFKLLTAAYILALNANNCMTFGGVDGQTFGELISDAIYYRKPFEPDLELESLKKANEMVDAEEIGNKISLVENLAIVQKALSEKTVK